MKMEIQLKLMGCSKNGSKWEIHSNKCLHQEIRKISKTKNSPQTTRKRKKGSPKLGRKKF